VRPADSIRGRLGDERGSVLVFVLVGLPILLAVFAIALDVGNWFVHHRSLQNQVDAAALAGGDLFGSCFNGAGSGPMITAANAYGGGTYNLHYGGTGNGTEPPFNYNSATTYPWQKGSDGGLGDICTSLKFDVKGSEDNIPLIFGGLLPGSAPLAHIDANARVELRQEQSATGEFPLAVPNVNPKTVTATFVDESTGNTLSNCPNGCVFKLSPGGSVNGLSMWSGPATFPVPSSGTSAGATKIGVRIGLANAGQGCANTAGNTGYVCYDNTNTNIGLAVLRAYPTTGYATQPNAPILRGVVPATVCSGSPFFSDYSLSTGATSCAAGVQATVDFGTGAVDPTKTTGGGVGATLTATVNGTTAPMTYSAVTNLWSTTAGAFTIPQDSGPFDVSLNWSETAGTCTVKKPCSGTWSSVQRIYSGDATDSGSISTLSLSEPSASNPGAPYSMPSTPSSHTVTVTVGIGGTLELSNQVVLLRQTGGSRSSAIACDGSGANSFRTAIEIGCQTPYQINTKDLCPDPSPPAGAADCINTQTGDMRGPTTEGLNVRFASCPADNWPNYNPQTDPRLVQLLVTDFSYLGGNGSTSVPVVEFADFYIAGWDNSSCNNGLAWPFPFKETNGDIWGYFVKDVTGNGVAGNNTCDPNSVSPCVAVMTR
jgi:Putative Flp pilus-assembly TadE/G-like